MPKEHHWETIWWETSCQRWPKPWLVMKDVFNCRIPRREYSRAFRVLPDKTRWSCRFCRMSLWSGPTNISLSLLFQAEYLFKNSAPVWLPCLCQSLSFSLFFICLWIINQSKRKINTLPKWYDIDWKSPFMLTFPKAFENKALFTGWCMSADRHAFEMNFSITEQSTWLTSLFATLFWEISSSNCHPARPPPPSD